MNKLFLFLASIFLLMSCGQKQQAEEEKADVEEFAAIAKNTSEASEKKSDAKEYEGTYSAIMPDASGQAAEVTISLSGNEYTRSTLYIGQSTPKVEKGIFFYSPSQNKVVLTEAAQPNQYTVGEKSLIQHEKDGSKITGPKADDYTLRKE